LFQEFTASGAKHNDLRKFLPVINRPGNRVKANLARDIVTQIFNYPAEIIDP
jgi:hypothetical protein